jgi:NitT/TauT family transport system ATP-binding protein
LLTQQEGRGEVFELAENLGVDYDRMTAVTRAAEQLGWVTTPGEVVQLTPPGREFMSGDAAARKAAVRERLSRHPLFARVLAMLQESGDVGEERGILSDEDVVADLTIHFPFIPAESLFATIVEWGRDAGLLDHDAEGARLTLMET